MKKLLAFIVLMGSVALTGCGGSGNTISGPGGGAGGPSTATTINLIVSSPQLQSDNSGLTTVTITAILTDSINNVVEGSAVVFSPDSGSIQVTQATTDSNGIASAELSNGANNSTNRTIVVTATSGTATATISVSVTGTTLAVVNGPSALAQNDSALYEAFLQDSAGVGIPGVTLDITSGNGNTLDASTLTTAANGAAEFNLTASAAGLDTLTITGLGLTASFEVNVTSDNFAIIAPAADTEVALNTDQTVTAEWIVAGTPQAGQVIDFSATRGTLGSSSVVTDGAGRASVTINSTNAGPSVVTVSNPDGTTTFLNIEFVADTADSLILQAAPFTVATGEQSEIRAIVRDVNGNLVKNKLVVFELTDVTNGFLSVGTATTDSQGAAQTFYTGGSVPSAVDGISIRAFVSENPPLAPSVEDTVLLTVAQKEVDIFIGTGDFLFLLGTAQYAKEWVVLVTDTVGNPVANSDVQMSLKSVRYYKGSLELFPDSVNPIAWRREVSTIPGELSCIDEDTNRDGFLDLIAEDFNGNGMMEAGNVATVVAVPPGTNPDDVCSGLTAGGGSQVDVTTDASGFASVCVVYPRSVNLWADVRLTAQLSVFGSEFSESQEFLLQALASDLNDVTTSPAGEFSPFGEATTCANPD